MEAGTCFGEGCAGKRRNKLKGTNPGGNETMKRRLPALIAALALGAGAALGVAACGDDDESTTVEEIESVTTDVTETTETEETTTEETTTEEGDDSGGSASDDSGGSSGLGY